MLRVNVFPCTVMMYHGPGNIPEAVMAGKIAAKEKP